MQDVDTFFLEFLRADALLVHRHGHAAHGILAVDLADLVEAGILDAETLVAPQKLHEQSVEVFRARADDDLLRRDIEAAEAAQMIGDCLAQAHDAHTGRALQELFGLLRHDLAQEARPRLEREILGAQTVSREVGQVLRQTRFRFAMDTLRLSGLDGQAGKTRDKESLLRHRLAIAFRHQLTICALDRDDADAELVRERALRRQLLARLQAPGEYVRADAAVEVLVERFRPDVLE